MVSYNNMNNSDFETFMKEVYERLRLYAFEYEHDGVTWLLSIYATSEPDAWQRIADMQHARSVGEVKIVAHERLGFAARLYCSLRNLFRRRAG